MPGRNLTREEAATRAADLDVTSYTIDLDLVPGTGDDETFGSTTRIEFTSSEPGTDTWIELVAARVHEVRLNDVALDPAEVVGDDRIALPGLAAENVLVVRADCAYSHTGEGMHRFVDPADDRVYLYSQFEVPDASRVYACFDQPDLKSVYTFNITAPNHWKVVSNAPTPTPESLDEGRAVWRFPQTKPMSTYVTAIVAGEYHEVQDVYEGKHGTIPLGHYCRQSLVDYLDRDELVKLTRQGFAFFEEEFGFPYPFEKYDHAYVPEYNMAAMENAGLITVRDEYLPRSRQPRSFYEFRASVILHEMAHMWFGDLVTMKWWDDLWLNESFAEWACYHAQAEATEFTEAWTGFTNARKITGYRADQLPSTHPIAADNHDLQAVETNFDMVTYAKGASVLKQLVAWVGLEPFLAGLRQYFQDHAYGNAVFDDLLTALERSSGRDLRSWAQEWLQTAGVNTLAADFETGDDGTYTSFAIRQSAAPDYPTLRRHRVGIGWYDEQDGRLVRTHYVETDVSGEFTTVNEALGRPKPALLLLNDEDHAYAKIRLDEQSLRTAIDGLSRVDDSLARALIWSAAWDMTRDAEMSATDFVTLVLGNLGEETDAWGITRIPANAAEAVALYSAPAHRAGLAETWERGLRKLLENAAPGSDSQLTFVRAYTGAAVTDTAVADLDGLLDGTVAFPGLQVDAELRWLLLGELARLGHVGHERIDEELGRDNTITGQEAAAAARASMPDPEAKAQAWQRVLYDRDTTNEASRRMALAFMRKGQDDVLTPYVDKYLEAAETAWETIGQKRAQRALDNIFPRILASQALLDKVDAWLETTTANPNAVRYVREGRADAARALAAQAKDAEEA